jgi:hypothetical protein
MTRASVHRKKVELKAKVQQEEQGAYQNRLLKIRLGSSYVTNKVKANYYVQRCNMLATEIEGARASGRGFINEVVDGVRKTLQFAESEYAMLKISATQCARQSYFDRQDLLKAGCSEEDIKEIESEYIYKPSERESYDDDFRRERQNGFIG